MSANFSQETFQFLTENRLRNDKAWFTQHKQDYVDRVIAPLAALATSLAPTMAQIDGQLILSPKVGGCISRIWRDARYSKDKSLFRDSMWLSMVRQKGQMLPEFFFVITPDNFLYGCGYYAADSASMDSFRQLILSDSPQFRKAYKMFRAQDRFVLEGDCYKRTRHPDQPEEKRDWLDRKVISLMRTSTQWDLLYSDQLAQVVAQDFKMIAPMYDLLIAAEERARKVRA